MALITPRRGYLERCWLYALRLAWAEMACTAPPPSACRPVLQAIGLPAGSDAFHRVLHALKTEGARYLYIEAPDAPRITGDEADLLAAMAAMALDQPMVAEDALGALVPAGNNALSLRRIGEIAAAARTPRLREGCLVAHRHYGAGH